MKAFIKVKLSELNESLLERIKALFDGQEDTELIISFDSKQEYYKTLDRSIKDLESRNNLISFTLEELESYTNRKRI
jgi:hypothetical protein